MVGHTHQSPEPYSTQQLSRHAATHSKCQQKHIHHRWKHEIPIAIPATTRAVFPVTSAREQWLLAGLTDSAASHWVRAPPLDGGDDEDADTGD